MKKYNFTTPRFTGFIVFHYNMTGQLIYFDNQSGLDHKGNTWLLRWLPHTIMDLLKLKTKLNGTLTEIK